MRANGSCTATWAVSALSMDWLLSSADSAASYAHRGRLLVGWHTTSYRHLRALRSEGRRPLRPTGGMSPPGSLSHLSLLGRQHTARGFSGVMLSSIESRRWCVASLAASGAWNRDCYKS
jgi:hypothetical protein